MPANHPLRKIRNLVRDVLGELNRSLTRLYASEGRPSIPPEQLLSALLLNVYGIRSERQLMEQLDYNLLYRWFGTFARRQQCRSLPRGAGQQFECLDLGQTKLELRSVAKGLAAPSSYFDLLKTWNDDLGSPVAEFLVVEHEPAVRRP